jgi:hypothetical protein
MLLSLIPVTSGEAMQRLLLPFVVASLLALATGVAAQPLACSTPQKSQQVAELMFGRKIGDRIAVTEAQWARFVDQEITPRFPDGLTVFDARGQWRDPDKNRIVREPSKVVTIVLPGSAEDAQRITEIAEAYKKRFQQQSVGVILRPACVSF